MAMKKIVFSAVLVALICGCKHDLESWNKDSESYKHFMDEVRVSYYGTKTAVFDFDGTLFCERDKTYFDWVIASRFVVDNAVKFNDNDIRLASEVLSTGKIPDLDSEDNSFMHRVWDGVPLRVYCSCINKYLDEPMPSIPNLKRRDALFKPMIEVIEYLKSNGWRVFVCTGTDRWIARMVIPSSLIPPDDIIGSSFEYDVKYHRSGRVYDLIISGKIQKKNLNKNKIFSIMEEVGVRPDIVFGNSSGDYEMANMVIPDRVFMVICDDIDRDRGNIDDAMSVLKECRKKGWTPISIRNDWKVVYMK